MSYFDIILGLMAGIGIFLYGMHLVSIGMQKLAVSRMKIYIQRYTDNRFKGLIIGIIATFFMQSSTATSIIVVGLVGSSVLSLMQALGVLLGSSIGTTLTVQILAFNITEYAGILVFVGAGLIIFSSRARVKFAGQAFLGFGLLFFGIGFMSDALSPLAEDPAFIDFMITYESTPIMLFLLAVVLTYLMHSSAATIVLGMSLVGAGAMSFEAVVPVILGANLGTTLPALVSSLASSREGKKLALSYFFFKLVAVSLAFGLYALIIEGVAYLPGDLERQVANMHTAFNIGVALLFLPLLYYVAQMMDKLIPSVEEDQGVTFDRQLLELPDEALSKAQNEITSIGIKIDEQMLQPLPGLFNSPNYQDKATAIRQVERSIDQDYHAILQFLLKLGRQNLTEKQSDQEVKSLYVLNDLEHIGDIINQIGKNVVKMKEQGIHLTDQDQQELVELSQSVLTAYRKSLQAYVDQDERLAKEVINQHASYAQRKNDMMFNHFNHLIEEQTFNSQMSSKHLELINQLLRVHQHTVNMSQTVLGII